MYYLILIFFLNFILARWFSAAHLRQRSFPVRNNVLATILVEKQDVWRKQNICAAYRNRMALPGLCYHIFNLIVTIAAAVCWFAPKSKKIYPVILGTVTLTSFGQLLALTMMAAVFLAGMMYFIFRFLREDYGSRGVNIAVRTVLCVILLLVVATGILLVRLSLCGTW